MKKLVYAALAILVLLVVYLFVTKNAETPVAEEFVDEINVVDVIACDCAAPCDCANDQENCECLAKKEACDCSDENADGAIADVVDEEEYVEEVYEDNPDETSHEDETIIAE